jgi:hypothetical protein
VCMDQIDLKKEKCIVYDFGIRQQPHFGEALARCAAATLLLHCCDTVMTLLLFSSYAFVKLLLHVCDTVVTLLLHCCYTVATLL